MAIIALDGLEPSLITDETSHLLQDEHGTIAVDVSPLQTPVIWAAFLTGQQEPGVAMRKFPYNADEKISRVLGPQRVAAIHRFYSKLPNRTVAYTKDDLTHPTIFDLVDKPIALDIPAYNEAPAYVEVRRKIENGYELEKQVERLIVKQIRNAQRKPYAEHRVIFVTPSAVIVFELQPRADAVINRPSVIFEQIVVVNEVVAMEL